MTGQPEDHGAYCPTAEEIREACEAIRSARGPLHHANSRESRLPDWTPPLVSELWLAAGNRKRTTHDG